MRNKCRLRTRFRPKSLSPRILALRPLLPLPTVLHHVQHLAPFPKNWLHHLLQHLNLRQSVSLSGRPLRLLVRVGLTLPLHNPHNPGPLNLHMGAKRLTIPLLRRRHSGKSRRVEVRLSTSRLRMPRLSRLGRRDRTSTRSRCTSRRVIGVREGKGTVRLRSWASRVRAAKLASTSATTWGRRRR